MNRFIIQCSLIFLCIFVPTAAFAQNEFGNFEAAGQLLGNGNQSIDQLARQNNSVVSFIGAVARVVTAIIITISLIAIVVAGYIYMTAGGDASRVGLAKTIISSALLGIVLALAAVVILRTINPELVPTTDPAALQPRN